MGFGFGKGYTLVFNGETYDGEIDFNSTIADILYDKNLVREDIDLDKNYDIRVDNCKEASTFKFGANYEPEEAIITVTPKIDAG